jgi:hypothetical protein
LKLAEAEEWIASNAPLLNLRFVVIFISYDLVLSFSSGCSKSRLPGIGERCVYAVLQTDLSG